MFFLYENFSEIINFKKLEMVYPTIKVFFNQIRIISGFAEPGQRFLVFSVRASQHVILPF